MSRRNNRLNLNAQYLPKKCWVGDTAKIIYQDRDEAELAAKVAGYDHGVELAVYKCEYGNHWHLSSKE